MNCAQHTEIAATAFCRECGKPMCLECQRLALGSVYCDVHLPVSAPPPVVSQPPTPAPSWSAAPDSAPPYATPYSTPPASSPYTAATPALQPDESVHPALALLLGFI